MEMLASLLLILLKYNGNMWLLLVSHEDLTLSFKLYCHYVPPVFVCQYNIKNYDNFYLLVMLTNQEVLFFCVLQMTSFHWAPLSICTHELKNRIIAVHIFSGLLSVSHAPALLSGIFIPTLQSTNRLWLAAAGTARSHTRIRAGLHENCATNRNRPAAFSCTLELAGWGSGTARG